MPSLPAHFSYPVPAMAGRANTKVFTMLLTTLAAMDRTKHPWTIPLKNYRGILDKLTKLGCHNDWLPSLGNIQTYLLIGHLAMTGLPHPDVPLAEQALNPAVAVAKAASEEPSHGESLLTRVLARLRTHWGAKAPIPSGADHLIAELVNQMCDSNLVTLTSLESYLLVPAPTTEQPVSATPSPVSPNPFTEQQTMTTTPTQPDDSFLSALNDPAKLGDMLAKAVTAASTVPTLNKRVDMLTADLAASSRVNADLTKQVEELTADLKTARATASTVPVAQPSQQGQTNNLDELAQKLHITRAQLDSELTAFVQACSAPLVNSVRWPDWCNPQTPGSLLPFLFDNSRPVFLSGPSGSGKTFIAEALAFVKTGRRCTITHHEKISYAKLFIRDTVENGQVRGVLGPVLLAMLTGTPLVLDEIDHADVFVQSLMHELLDKRRVFIPELACVVFAEPNCRVIATGNSLSDDSGQYHGEVGTALRTRFAAIHVDYPTESDEADTIQTASSCPQKTAQLIAKTFTALRKAEQENKLAGPMSVRESCAVGQLFVQAKASKLSEQQALAVAFKVMVTDKRPPSEQQTAAEIVKINADVDTTAFLSAVK